MDTNLLTFGAIALGLIAVTCGCGCYLWRRSHPRTASARLTPDGIQIINVLVRDGYHPAKIRVHVGRPVRLMLRREEDDPCSSGIYLTEPPLRRHLPAFATTVITFTPEKTGDHLFTCEEGRHRGHLIVDPPAHSHMPTAALPRGRATNRRSYPPDEWPCTASNRPS